MTPIEEIKQYADCVSLFRRFWPQNFKEHGNCVCPFHGDKEPSMQLTRDKAHCHAEGKSWDAIDLYQEGTGTSNKDAIKALRSELGLKDLAPQNGDKPSKSTNPSASVDIKTRWERLQAAIPPEGVSYLEERRGLKGITQVLVDKDLVRFEPKWPALVFPVHDKEAKELLSVQYVPLDGSDKKFAKGTKATDGFFILGNGGDYMVYSEAVIDALSIYLACKDDIKLDSVSTYSAATHRKVKDMFGLRRTLFFDNDSAGRIATIKSAISIGVGCKVVEWGDRPEKDANDLLKAGKSEEILKMVKGARPLETPAALQEFVELEIKSLQDLADKIEETDKRVKQKKLLAGIERDARDYFSGVPSKAENDPVKQAIAELNEKFAVIAINGSTRVLQEATNPITKHIEAQLWGIGDFKAFHANRKILVEEGDKLKKKDIGSLWFNSEDRRQYEGMIFCPNSDAPEGYYNLFRGYSCKPRKGNWDLMEEHIYEVMAGGNMDIFRYIIAWCANMFQDPGGNRPGTALVFRGEQGVGKGTFVNQLGKIMGPSYLHASSASRITGRFNSSLKHTLLVFLDEGFWAGDKQAEGVLKHLITEELLIIEHKGHEPYQVINHLRFIMASNNDWVVPSGFGERRFFVTDASPKRKKDSAYFGKILNQMDNGGREGMLHYFMNFDYSKVNLREFPDTQAGDEQKSFSMKTPHKWWSDRIGLGTILEGHNDWEITPIPTQKLFKEYVTYAKDIGERYPGTVENFVKQLKVVCPKMEFTRPYMGTDKVRCYRFPDHETCTELLRVAKIK